MLRSFSVGFGLVLAGIYNPPPQVVLATLPSLDCGPARQLLVDWAAAPRNTIIFTERANVRVRVPCV